MTYIPYGYSFEPPEDVIIAHCTRCGGEIYEGEEFYDSPDGTRRLCEDCIDDEWRDLSTSEKAALLGLEKAEVEYGRSGDD